MDNHQEFDAELDQLPNIIAFLEAFPKDGDIKQRDLELIVEELFVNICLYAYPEKKGTVEVYVTDDPTFSITLRDQGVSFNPVQKSNHRTPKNVENTEIGGLGLHFIHSLAKEVSYGRIDQMNQTTITM